MGNRGAHNAPLADDDYLCGFWKTCHVVVTVCFVVRKDRLAIVAVLAVILFLQICIARFAAVGVIAEGGINTGKFYQMRLPWQWRVCRMDPANQHVVPVQQSALR